jgi:hypothetical protein
LVQYQLIKINKSGRRQVLLAEGWFYEAKLKLLKFIGIIKNH